MRSQIELEFWQDVFLAALKNPKIIEIMAQTAKETNQMIPEQLAALTDKLVGKWRERTSEREGKVYFEYNPLNGIPK